MGEPEVNAFLTDLAVRRRVSASTQGQALSALVYLYAAILARPLDEQVIVRAPRLLRERLEGVRDLHRRDLAAGYGAVYLPDALAVKYPNAAREWAWQYVFPSRTLSEDPRTGERRRHHLNEATVSREVTAAVKRSG